MRLPDSAHTSRPWRIHELTGDFRLEDTWALPTPGGPDDFPRLVQLFASDEPSQPASRTADALWAIRWKVGMLLGWDVPDAGLGSRVPTLRDRLPEDLRDAPSGPDLPALPFTSLYLIDDEWAAEIANRTMHGVMHISWVPDGTGGYRGQMAVLVKPNGLLGTAYMAAIRPFRHLIVYPAMLREIGWSWRPMAAALAPAERCPLVDPVTSTLTIQYEVRQSRRGNRLGRPVLTEEMKRVVLEQKLGFAATVCPDGTPNLSPKGTTTVWDDAHLVFADIRSPKTVLNLRGNPSIEINVVDPVVRKGYRFKGRAELHTSGELYEHGLRLLAGRGFDARRERIKTIVLVRVEQAVALVSPAYDGGASEDEVAARWEAHAEALAKRRHEVG